MFFLLFFFSSESLNHGLKYCPDLTRSMNYLLATGNLISPSGLGLMQVYYNSVPILATFLSF